jgi:hypothetical protein
MEQQQYNWSAGNGTVGISLASDVISRLRSAAESPDGTPQEIGGILLGRRESEDRIFIQDFEPVTCEHRRGLTFTLSGHDKQRLTQHIRATHGGLDPLGSFRTHLRQGLYMDQYDFELMSEFFAGASDVMLLVRPADWQAGFFVWEEGEMSRQKSYQEFPFDPLQLPLTPVPQAGIASPGEPTAISIRRRVPTLMRAGLIAGTAGLAGVLAFYTHGVREHRYSLEPRVVSAAVAKPSVFASPPKVEAIYPPVDPDIGSGMADAQYELHVKVPGSDGDSSPQQNRSAVGSVHTQPEKPYKAIEANQPAPPPQPPQTAINLPPTQIAPVLTRPVLKPVHPALVSEVLLEPAQPGVIRRGLHHVPVLNLFGKHSYKSGDEFSPARPLREVKPELLDDNARQATVDVRVWIDDNGEVTKTELISDHVAPEVADIASNAANKWKFSPAHISDRPVSSEMVMHFHFVPQTTY